MVVTGRGACLTVQRNRNLARLGAMKASPYASCAWLVRRRSRHRLQHDKALVPHVVERPPTRGQHGVEVHRLETVGFGRESAGRSPPATAPAACRSARSSGSAASSVVPASAPRGAQTRSSLGPRAPAARSSPHQGSRPSSFRRLPWSNERRRSSACPDRPKTPCRSRYRPRPSAAPSWRRWEIGAERIDRVTCLRVVLVDRD